MPRKVNYGLDYDDDYGDEYDDYDDYYEDYGEVPETKQETPRPPGVWRCTICTYDNDESMTSCDICGVIRRDFVNTGTSNIKQTVEDISKTSGASKLARSLFASLPKQNPKEVVLLPKQDDGFQTDASNFCKHRNVQGEFHECHKAFNTKSHSHLNIGLPKS
ncbi:hypothetical protein S83_045564 [Arachis hypogaea]